LGLIYLYSLVSLILESLILDLAVRDKRKPGADMLQERLRILVVGSGGREHALAWKLSQSSLVDSVHVAPGNGGTAEGSLPKVSNIDIKVDDYPRLVKFAQENNINLVVPGPEAPLVDGIQGFFQAGKHMSSIPSLYYSLFRNLTSTFSWHPMFRPIAGCGPHGGIKNLFQGFYAKAQYTHSKLWQFQ
jgi:hypothetical protein